MEVYYGKTKTPIVFSVGGVIVAIVTTFFVKFCSFYPIGIKFGTQDSTTGDGGTGRGIHVLGHRVL